MMLRPSVQFAPRYRLGWVVACNEAKLGINDPKWKRAIPPEYCKLLDTSFAFAMNRVGAKLKIHRPDLVAEGDANEYLPIQTETTGEITNPDFSLLEEEVPVEIK